MKPWTSTRLCKTILSKKRRAATGRDGVSRCDLAYFAQVFPQPFTDLFDAIEGGRPWPRQLTRGFVASLYKNKGDGGVDRYRPIAVFPLLYRVWSTCRASYSLHSLMPVLPKSIAGGVPGRQATAVWIEVAQAIEDKIARTGHGVGHLSCLQRHSSTSSVAFPSGPTIPFRHLLSLGHLRFVAVSDVQSSILRGDAPGK